MSELRVPGGSQSAVLGADASGAFEIDLIRDGPHALVAGTTGSGKSELLRTLVASLALRNSPQQMSFVLIDYKGGAAFGECERLPHVVGLVTDLDHSLTERALQSLGAELRTRERLFADAGAANLEGYRSAPRRTPVARLVLVIDEFATLAEELPDFVTGLVGIARRGRSLGVHLVLATQRPGGVVSPEIRANVDLRIALRVTDAAESTDVVGCDAAAWIDRSLPGRAFVRAKGVVSEIQAAQVVEGRRFERDVEVLELDSWGRARLEPPGGGSQLRALVDSIRVNCADEPRAPRRGFLH